jgi:hypothetical protein
MRIRWLWLNFEPWSSASTDFHYERIYLRGRWTPFVWVSRRSDLLNY